MKVHLVTFVALFTMFVAGCDKNSPPTTGDQEVVQQQVEERPATPGTRLKVPAELESAFDSPNTLAIGRFQLGPWSGLQQFIDTFDDLRVPRSIEQYLTTIANEGPLEAAQLVAPQMPGASNYIEHVDLERDAYVRVNLDTTSSQRWRHVLNLGLGLPPAQKLEDSVHVDVFVPATDVDELAAAMSTTEEGAQVEALVDYVVVRSSPRSVAQAASDEPPGMTPARHHFATSDGLASLWISGELLDVFFGVSIDEEMASATTKALPEYVTRLLASGLGFLSMPIFDPNEFHDHSFVFQATEGLGFSSVHSHTSKGVELHQLATAHEQVTLPSLTPPGGMKPWLEGSVGLDSAALDAAFHPEMKRKNSVIDLVDIPECVQNQLPKIGSVNAALVFCARSFPAIEGVMPVAARFISWGELEGYGPDRHALVMSVRGDISVADLQKRLGERVTVTKRDGDLLVFQSTEPKASLGKDVPLKRATADVYLDLARIPEWTQHKRARVLESLHFNYRTLSDQTLADVRIMSEKPPVLEASNVDFSPPEVPKVACVDNVQELIFERAELMDKVERTAPNGRGKLLSTRIPELMSQWQSVTEKCIESDPERQTTYRESLGFAHVWAGMSFFDIGSKQKASTHFASACELTDTIDCKQMDGDGPMAVCPAPYLGEVAVTTKDLSAGDVVDEQSFAMECNALQENAFEASELQDLKGRKVRDSIESGKVILDYRLEQ